MLIDNEHMLIITFITVYKAHVYNRYVSGYNNAVEMYECVI